MEQAQKLLHLSSNLLHAVQEHFPSRTLILTMIREPVLHVQSQMNHQNYHHHGVPMTPSERIEAWLVYLLGQVEVNGTLRVKQE